MAEPGRCRRCKGEDPRFCIKCVGEISGDGTLRALVSEFVDASLGLIGTDPAGPYRPESEVRFREALSRLKVILGKE